uniref:Large ribosomal subunit protein mL42 n=1 Tax=Cebus imitator TaxID=2715852 RepID=A0A2K5R4B0_CEBIM
MGDVKENYLETFISNPKWIELALTSDGRTIVYPVHNNEETHDQILKTRLEEKVEPLEQGPMVEQLSKMFFTTKYHWYPYGRYHRCRKNPNPPKDS